MQNKIKSQPPPKNPLNKKEDVEGNPDKKIKEDFPGYPHPPSSEDQIDPPTDTDKAIASVGAKDGEKKNKDKHKTDESSSDGSANAFEATEEVKE